MLRNRLPAGQHLGVHVAVEVRGLAEVLGEDAAGVHHPGHVGRVGPVLHGVLLPAAVAVEDDDQVLRLQARVGNDGGAVGCGGQQPVGASAQAEGRRAGGAEKVTAIHAHCDFGAAAGPVFSSGRNSTSRPRISSSRTGFRFR